MSVIDAIRRTAAEHARPRREIRVRGVNQEDLNDAAVLARRCGYMSTDADVVRFAIGLIAELGRLDVHEDFDDALRRVTGNSRSVVRKRPGWSSDAF